MCGRYSDLLSWQEIHDLYRLTDDIPAMNLEPRWNIAPTQKSLVIRRQEDGKRRADMLRWGLIPFFAKDPKKLPLMVNARAEAIITLPSYRDPIRKRRALAVADGYYEWTGPKGDKQPWRFTRVDGKPITFPAIWETWKPKEGVALPTGFDGETVESYAIVTTEPSSDISHIHDRMPVLLEPGDNDLWLDPDPGLFEKQMALLKPAPIGTLRFVPVSKKHNSSRNEGPELIEPVVPNS